MFASYFGGRTYDLWVQQLNAGFVAQEHYVHDCFCVWKSALEAKPVQGDQCLVPSSACLVLVAALARPGCGVVLASEGSERTWRHGDVMRGICVVLNWYWLFIASF